MSEPEPPAGLDPDRAIEIARGTGPAPEGERMRRPPAPVIDTRRYQWMIGGFGLLLLFIFSVYLYATNGSTTPGVAAGQRLHRFVAPLATSDLNAAANAHPRCDPARPALRGLNVCNRAPIVLAFFTTGAAPCIREVNTLQAVSGRFPGIQFAAVAVNADRASTAALVRSHHWTIPVAYDLTGGIGDLYGVAVCPIVELARAGGVVAQRLIGEGWENPDVLAGRVAQLTRAGGGAS